MSRRTPLRATLALAALLLGACASIEAPPPEPAPQAAACPKGVPDGARCLRGRDSVGAHVLIVVPQAWSGVLVVHAHGGPTLGEPKVERADEDIARWAIVVRMGHAYAASVFRQGGVAVRSAAEDTERVRRLFVEHVAKPRRTILHGQSWGASVAAKAAEMYPRAWDGVLLTSGTLASPDRVYNFRLDLRAVYQVLCQNHPRPDEEAYPLWMGLPPHSKLTRADLAARVDECLGTGASAARRTPEQARRLKTIADVIRIPPTSVGAHLAWATWHFQDIAQHRTGGGNPFDNQTARYQGSSDDASLNAAVPRYRADPAAVARLAADFAPTGRIDVPVLTTHGIGDPTVFVEVGSEFRRTMEQAGRGDRLVQTFVDLNEHSYLGDATYPPLIDALLDWIEQGRKPTPADVAARCAAQAERWKAACRFAPDYRVAPLDSRITPR